MKIGVWGAGRIGCALVRRLATTPFTSEIVWANRSVNSMESVAIDVEQSLAFAPTCRRVSRHVEARAQTELQTCDVVVVTHGAGVSRNGARAQLYPENARILRERAIPALRGFHGIVLVVTNPVDSLARLVREETGLPEQRVLGLGTVVETARLRAILSGLLIPRIPARDLWAFVVGTHDENFVEIIPERFGAGAFIPRRELDELLPCIREGIQRSAERIKATGDNNGLREALRDALEQVRAAGLNARMHEPVQLVVQRAEAAIEGAGTCQPIVEGVVQVIESIAFDRHATLTVSTRDPEVDEYYSVPCTVGGVGILARRVELLDQPGVVERLGRCIASLRAVRGATDPRATA